MREELVTFPTAQLAKEKGFDLSTKNWFDTNVYNYEKQKPLEWESSTYKKFNAMGSNKVSRPSQSLLQRWLREVHNIYVEPFVITDRKEITFTCSVSKGTRLIDAVQIGEFNTYEEALEVALQKALKMVDVKKPISKI